MPSRTNGIREIVGETLTAPYAVGIAHAVHEVAPPEGSIALARDARTSSPALEGMLAGTLQMLGRDVIDIGLLPTPAFQRAMPGTGAVFGVMVTASHNPPEYNGFKCVGASGRSIPREVEERIETRLATPTNGYARYDHVGSVRPGPPAAEEYIEGILASVDRPRIAERRFTVVLDCGNGVTARTSPELLRRLGCRVVSLNAHLDGEFPGHPSEPNETTVRDLGQVVRAVGADLGIAHDGDGDRTIFVDGSGRFVPGDRSLALLARERVRAAGSGAVVTPVSTSQVVEDVVRPLGGRVVYTPVGSRSLSREVERTGACIGGEENGGVIFPEWQLARDGAMAAASMLALLSRSPEPIARMLDDLPAYASVKTRMPCPPDQVEHVLRTVVQSLRPESHRVDDLDGWKLYTDGGWLLLRASGTEPIIRVFAETRDASSAKRLADEALRRLQEQIHPDR